jgi:hypothetical protein
MVSACKSNSTFVPKIQACGVFIHDLEKSQFEWTHKLIAHFHYFEKRSDCNLGSALDKMLSDADKYLRIIMQSFDEVCFGSNPSCA